MLSRLLKRLAGIRDVSDPDVTTEALFRDGTAAFMAGDFAKAERLLAAVTTANPAHAQAWFNRAAAFHRRNLLMDATRCCTIALQLEPSRQDWRDAMKHLTNDLGYAGPPMRGPSGAANQDDWVAQLAAGNTFKREGRMAEAEQSYRLALAASEKSPYVARRLGSLLAINGNRAEADALFRHSASFGLDPDTVVRLADEFLDEINQAFETRIAALPAISGTFGSTTRSCVYFLSCDPAYFRKFGFALLNSLRTNCKHDFAVHLHLVNPDASCEAEAKAVAAGFGIDEFFVSCETARFANLQAQKTYYACARFLRFPALLKAYRRPVWLLDLDQLVVSDPQAVVLAVDDAPAPDVALVRFDATRSAPWDQFSATAVFAGPTPAAHLFLERVAAYVAFFLEQGAHAWFLDQLGLFSACAQAESGASIRFLESKIVCLANPEIPAEPPAGTVFWTIVGSVEASIGSLAHPIFTRYDRGGRSSMAN